MKCLSELQLTTSVEARGAPLRVEDRRDTSESVEVDETERRPDQLRSKKARSSWNDRRLSRDGTRRLCRSKVERLRCASRSAVDWLPAFGRDLPLFGELETAQNPHDKPCSYISVLRTS